MEVKKSMKLKIKEIKISLPINKPVKIILSF